MSLLAAPPRYQPSVRGDAMLLTHGGAGTERLIAVGLLLDAVLAGQLDIVADSPQLVVGPRPSSDAPPLLTGLRDRVLEAPPASPRAWIARAIEFATSAVEIELITAGVAEPLAHRFQRDFTLSFDAHAEADARHRLTDPSTPALAGALWSCGGFRAVRFPPPLHTLPPAARAILGGVSTGFSQEQVSGHTPAFL